MREGTGYTETLRAGTSMTVGSVTLLPIERVVLHSNCGARHAWCLATKEPCVLIVRDTGGVRAISTHATAISPDTLREHIPGLDGLLAVL